MVCADVISLSTEEIKLDGLETSHSHPLLSNAIVNKCDAVTVNLQIAHSVHKFSQDFNTKKHLYTSHVTLAQTLSDKQW